MSDGVVALELHYLDDDCEQISLARSFATRLSWHPLATTPCIDLVAVANPGRGGNLSETFVLVTKLYQDRQEIVSFCLPVNRMISHLSYSTDEEYGCDIMQQIEGED